MGIGKRTSGASVKQLHFVHIQTCRPDRSAPQRIDQRRFIGCRSSGAVYEDSALLQPPELVLAANQPIAD